MDPRAVTKAKEFQQRAIAARERFRTAPDFETMKAGWIDFLSDCGTLFNALEEGAKSHPTSRQWFGAVNKERTDDPMLAYVHQARNAKEHGLREILIPMEAGKGLIGDPSGEVQIAFAMLFIGDQAVFRKGYGYEDPLTHQEAFQLTEPKLVTVHNDIFKNSWDPPTHFMGRPIGDNSPVNVAALQIDYQDKLILVAEHHEALAANIK